MGMGARLVDEMDAEEREYYRVDSCIFPQMDSLVVYKKLQEARVELQNADLKKSGKNTYSGYSYFTLEDFLPATQRIFAKKQLCGIVSFNENLASLVIMDYEFGGVIQIHSPMGSANLKGCHEVQNIGAVETYQRRYLWMAAMELVEEDEIDTNTGRDGERAEANHSPAMQKSAPNKDDGFF